MKKCITLVLFLTSLMACAQPVAAGDIVLEQLMGNNVIKFSGPVEIGDFNKFDSVSAKVPDATVILSSPGGLLTEGLRIGDSIRRKGYSTKVVSGLLCASACGYMWLAGRERVVEGDGKVGFHAAYKWRSKVNRIENSPRGPMKKMDNALLEAMEHRVTHVGELFQKVRLVKEADLFPDHSYPGDREDHTVKCLFRDIENLALQA